MWERDNTEDVKNTENVTLIVIADTSVSMQWGLTV